MSWVTIIWSMIISACLTLALVHALVWWWRREKWAPLLFALSAIGTAFGAACELGLMRAQTVEEYAQVARYIHLPIALILLSLTGFVLLYMRAGSLWIACTVVLLRILALVVNFGAKVSLNYQEITSLRQIRFLGEPVTLAVTTPNPLWLIGTVSLLLLIVLIAQASITAWRRSEKRQALFVGGAMIFFIVMGHCQALLSVWGTLPLPYMGSPFYMAIALAISFDLSYQLLRAAQLADDLSESEERVSLATEAAGLGIWMFDTTNDEVWGSERWMSQIGFPAEMNVHFGDVIQRIHPDDRESVENGVFKSLRERSEYSGEFRVVLPDGSHRWIASRGRVYPTAKGNTTRMMGISLDITQRKKDEFESQRSRAEIARLSRVAMSGELSGSLAHELNQPLTAILSNAQAALRFLARDDADLDMIREILQDIVSDDQRAGEVIHRLRLLLKKGEVNFQPLNLNEVVQDVLKLVRAELLSHNIRLETKLAEDLPIVQGDRVQLQQVLLNLIVNASDAMAQNTRSDRQLTLCAESNGEGGVCVSVIDRGTGLTPEVLEKIFDPFFTTKDSGMGLGLKVCRTIIEAHGGNLAGKNNADHGATFYFTLPGRNQ